jgi:glycosyltransferase involved in cell wall biosynthesis
MPSTALPRVSICLLTYRRAHVLPRTLDSLLRQTHSDFELIINDDCSPDDTATVCLEYARRDPRIRYCRNERNLRYTGNQNAAIQRARTDYVGFVHDGDLYRADLVEKWTEALVRHPTAALVFNTAEYLDEYGNVVGTYRHPYTSLVQGLQLFDEMLLTTSSPIFGITMVRRSRVVAVGPFDPRLPVLADIDMWLRLLLGNDAAYVAEPLYAIAPREADHQNSYENWRVHAEHELIHALNYRRRFGEVANPEATAAHRAITKMFWRMRLQALAACVRHVRPAAFYRGLAFCRERPRPLELVDIPDSVLSWDSLCGAEPGAS